MMSEGRGGRGGGTELEEELSGIRIGEGDRIADVAKDGLRIVSKSVFGGLG